MLKSTARAEQFYTRTGSEATKGSRKGFSLLGGGECVVAVMSDVQRDEAARHALNIRITRVEGELHPVKHALGTMRDKYGPEWKRLLARRDQLAAERKELLLKVQEINARIRLARPKPPASAVPNAFMDIARNVLTEAQFKMILRAAYERAASPNNSPVGGKGEQ